MEQIKKEMIAEAKEKAIRDHGQHTSYPIGTKETFDECFTECAGMLIFWFDVDIDVGNDTVGRTTKIVTRRLNG